MTFEISDHVCLIGRTEVYVVTDVFPAHWRTDTSGAMATYRTYCFEPHVIMVRTDAKGVVERISIDIEQLSLVHRPAELAQEQSSVEADQGIADHS